MADGAAPPAAPGTPILERLTGALGALLLLGACGALAWDAWSGEGRPADFAFRVLEVVPAGGGRHLVRFEVENVGGRTAGKVAVRGVLAADPAESARLIVDFLAAGERREGAFLFAADPAAFPLDLAAESFGEP
jgi:uncharacterized protein (TIGR02588 family)